MGLRALLHRVTGPSRKAGVGAIVAPWAAGVPQYPGTSYTAYAKEGFEKNELVYSCITKRMKAIAESPLRVYDAAGAEIPNHPTRALFARPNEFMGESMLWQMVMLYLDLAGVAPLEKVRSANRNVVELWPLRPDRIRVVPDAKDFIRGYVYEIDGQRYELPREDVIWFKNPHPRDDYFGLPTLRAGLRATARDNEATDFSKVLLQNRAIPGTIVTMQERMDGEGSKRRLRAKWNKEFGRDAENRGGVLFAQQGMDVKTLGLNMSELAFPDLSNISESRICMIFGMPPILIAAKVGLDAGTFSNYGMAREALQEDTINPIRRDLCAQINLDDELTPKGVETAFDTDNVAALEGQRSAKRTWAREGYRDGVLTLNESRALVGLEETTDGDTFRSPAPQLLDASGQDLLGAKARRRGKRKAVDASQLVSAIGRVAFAERYGAKVKALAAAIFTAQAGDIRAAFTSATKALDKAALDRLLQALAELVPKWTDDAAARAQPLLAEILGRTAESASASVGVDFELSGSRAQEFMRAHAYSMAKRVADTSAEDVRAALEAAHQQGLTVAQTSRSLEEKFAGWMSTRSDLVAQTETINAAAAGTRLGYREAGVEKKGWLAADDACPEICLPMNGVVVGIDEEFLLPNGERVQGPTAHPGCRCALTAEGV